MSLAIGEVRGRAHNVPCPTCHRKLSEGFTVGLVHTSSVLVYHPDCVSPTLIRQLIPNADYQRNLATWTNKNRLERIRPALDAALCKGWADWNLQWNEEWHHDPDYYLDQGKAEQLTCGVCKNIMHEPVGLPCDGAHLLCQGCWMVLRLSSPNGSAQDTVPCPLCREECDVKDVHLNRAVRKSIEFDMQILCKQHEVGCEYKCHPGREFVNVLKHDQVCGWHTVQCSDCGSNYLKKDKDQHLQTDCTFKCPFCQLLVLCVDKAQHLAASNNHCVNTTVCPHGCSSSSEVFLLEKFDEHLLRCPSMMVLCHDPACNKLHRRGDLHKEITKNIETIYPAIIEELQRLRLAATTTSDQQEIKESIEEETTQLAVVDTAVTKKRKGKNKKKKNKDHKIKIIQEHLSSPKDTKNKLPKEDEALLKELGFCCDTCYFKNVILELISAAKWTRKSLDSILSGGVAYDDDSDCWDEKSFHAMSLVDMDDYVMDMMGNVKQLVKRTSALVYKMRSDQQGVQFMTKIFSQTPRRAITNNDAVAPFNLDLNSRTFHPGAQRDEEKGL